MAEPANPLDGVFESKKVVALPVAQPAGADLNRLRKFFEEARDLTADARKESLTDCAYYDSKQWSPEELAVLAARKQPDIVINRVKPAVNGMIGVVNQGRSDPRALPRNPQDEDSAEVATDTLRYIADKNRLHRLKQDCFLDMLVPGAMAALIGANEDLDVTVEQIRWEEFFADPRSRRRDYKDARFLGIAKWMYAEDVAGIYPDKADEIRASVDSALISGDVAFADRPFGTAGVWADRKQRRLIIIELYYREAGKWMRCVFHGGGILEEGPSPYKDEKGRPDCPIEAQAAYVDQDNNRYGVVRDMRGPQDEVNKRRSKALHLLNVRQVQVKDSLALESDAGKAAEAAAKPDGVLPPGYEIVPLNQSLQGHLELLQEAKAEIERMGPNPAILGRQGSDSSGRAQLIRQQAGMIELAVLFGALEDWELRVYRQMWARAKQYWKAPQFIRVTDDMEAPRFVGINQPVHEMAPVIDPATGQPQVHPDTQDNGQPHPMAGQPVMQPKLYPAMDGNGRPQVDPATGQPVMQPNVLGYKNAMAEMDVDIILDTTPDTGTLAQEQFSDFMQLLGQNPMWAQQTPLELVLQMSSIPHKRQMIEKLKAIREEAQKAQAEQQQQTQQIATAGAVAQIAKTHSEAGLNDARAQAEHAKVALHAVETGHALENTPPPGPPPIAENGRTGQSVPKF